MSRPLPEVAPGELFEPIRVEGASETWAGYARVSTAEQKRGKTIGGQLLWLADAAQERVINVDVYRDDGLSASNNDRPGLRGLYARLEAREYAGLVVIAPDRITRADELGPQAELLDPLRQMGVRVLTEERMYACTQAEDWSSMKHRALEAADERNRIQRRTHRGQRTALVRNRKPSGHDPWGLRYDRGRPGPDECWSLVESEAELTRWWCSLVLNDGLCLTDLAERTNARGQMRRDGGPWRGCDISRTLRAEYIAGLWAFQALAAELKAPPPSDRPGWALRVPAQVDRATWGRVVARLDANAPDKRRPYAKVQSLFRGRVYCAECGLPVHVKSDHRAGQPRVAFRCASTHRYFQSKGHARCALPYVPIDAVEPFAWDVLKQCLTAPGLAEEAPGETADRQKALELQACHAEAQLRDLRRHEGGHQRTFEAGVLSEEGYYDALERVTAQRRTAQSVLANAQRALADMAAAESAVRSVQDRLAGLRERLGDLSFEERRAVVGALCPERKRDGLFLRADGRHELRGVFDAAGQLDAPSVGKR